MYLVEGSPSKSFPNPPFSSPSPPCVAPAGSDAVASPGFSAAADVSFISLRLILPAVSRVLGPEGEAVCLVKPQFEAGRARVGKKGVVRDGNVHRQVLEELFLFFPTLGLYPAGLTWSPIRGPEGNIEYLCHLRRQKADQLPEPRRIVEEAHDALR